MTRNRRSSHYFSVDRLEGTIAVLVADDAVHYDVPPAELPRSINEGDVLVVSVSSSGAPDWRSATVDLAEKARRLARAKDALDRMRKRNRGGDITL